MLSDPSLSPSLPSYIVSNNYNASSSHQLLIPLSNSTSSTNFNLNNQFPISTSSNSSTTVEQDEEAEEEEHQQNVVGQGYKPIHGSSIRSIDIYRWDPLKQGIDISLMCANSNNNKIKIICKPGEPKELNEYQAVDNGSWCWWKPKTEKLRLVFILSFSISSNNHHNLYIISERRDRTIKTSYKRYHYLYHIILNITYM